MGFIFGYGLEESTELVRTETQDIVNDWFLMGSVWPTVGIISAYLLFVLIVGPKIMEKRKPLNITNILLAYNVFQVLQNLRILWLFVSTPHILEYLTKYMCTPMGWNMDKPYYYSLCYGAWCFFISKITDLFDTVFFVLRKKESHVSFLHVYHHTNMVAICWVYLKYMKDEPMVLVGVLNAWMHVTMYSYYFLAALGPAWRKYHWLKKCITRMQILQFLAGMVFLSLLVYHQCKMPWSHLLWFGSNLSIFLALFLRFYSKTYVEDKESLPVFRNIKNPIDTHGKKSHVDLTL